MSTLNLTPAYGRDYKSKVAVLKHWDEGKDFTIQSLGISGTYCSINDSASLRQRGITSIQFRYDNLRRTCVLSLLEEEGE